MDQGMAPEDHLCLLLARGELSPGARKQALELLASPLRWDVILRRAAAHQVFPLLYRNLRTLDWPGVPEEARSRIKSAFRLNALRNMQLSAELARLLRVLTEAGISVVPLKGVTLAASLYGDPAFRVCADLDVLVAPESLTHAIEAVRGSGYHDESTDPFFSGLALRYGRHYDLLRDGALPCLLEIHWRVVQNSSKNDEAVKDLWAEARPATFLGVKACALSAEWELLHLAIHAADHQWQTLKWLVDIHEICLGRSLDWRKLREKTERFELDSILEQTLTVCSSLLGTPTPAGFSPAAPPANARLFPAVPFPSEASEAALFHLRLLRRPLDRLRCLATILLVPKLPDRQLLRLPTSLGFLYYAVRPLRLACRWSWRLFSHTLSSFPVLVHLHK